MNILIAEDDAATRATLASALRKSGYEVFETVNGAEAFYLLQSCDAPRIAILDWMMPEMDGITVLKKLREIPSERPPYIIMLTVKGTKSDIISGLEAGANDYLSKPFDLNELKARIEVGHRMIELQEALIVSREKLAHQATHDPLTGLFNRRAILDHLHKELQRASRYGGVMAVGIFDIDHFKQINDTHGHQTGDEVLCSFADLISANIREYDAFGRMGGEEFLLITPLKSEIRPLALYERLRDYVASGDFRTRTGMQRLTTSIGVACAGPACTVDSLLERADKALLKAKNQGRNRIVFDPYCMI